MLPFVTTTLSDKLMLECFVAVKEKSDPHDHKDLFARYLFWHQFFWEAIQHLSSGVTPTHFNHMLVQQSVDQVIRMLCPQGTMNVCSKLNDPTSNSFSLDQSVGLTDTQEGGQKL